MKRLFALLLGITFAFMLFTASGEAAPALAAAPATRTCNRLAPQNRAECQQLEEQMLRSTVRILVQSWRVRPNDAGYDVSYSVGHATFWADCYLVTHNHFSIPITASESQNADAYVTITLYDAAGVPLLIGPVTDFRVVVEDVQTLVLEVTDEGDRRELIRGGVVSAAFRDWHSLSLKPEMEVAQVDWDGARARVDWTTINSVVTGDGTPRLELANGIQSGASGGGVFWQGYHVGTNWTLREYLDGTSGVVLRQASTAALNSEWVMRLLFLRLDNPSGYMFKMAIASLSSPYYVP